MTHMGEISGLSRREFQKTGNTPRGPKATSLNPSTGDRISISRETEHAFGILSEWMDKLPTEELARPEVIERARAMIADGLLYDEKVILKAAEGLICEETGIPSPDESSAGPA